MSPSRWPGRSPLPWGEPLGPSALPCPPQDCSSAVPMAVGVAGGGEAPWRLTRPGWVSAALLGAAFCKHPVPFSGGESSCRRFRKID